MKPRIGKEVYIIWNGTDIYKEKVAMLGKESFIVESIFNSALCDAYRNKTYDYDMYNKTWFTSITEAKKSLIDYHKVSNPNFDAKIKKVQDDCWEVFFK